MSTLREDIEQLKIAEEIANAYAKDKKIVIASLPCGAGKSGIAWFTHLKAQMSAAVFSHQKVLQDQYQELLYTKDTSIFTTLKGRDNYPCLIRKNTTAAYAPCAFLKNYNCIHYKNKSCGYMKAKKEAEETNFLNVNYQYMWNMQDMQEDFKFKKDLYIYDEAHNIQQLYTDHRSPKISHIDLAFYKKELEWAETYDIKELAYCSEKLIHEIRTIDSKKYADDEYLLTKLENIYTLKNNNAVAISSYIKENEQDLFETGHIKLLGALDKFECRSRTTYNILKDRNLINDKCIVEFSNIDADKFTLSLTSLDISKLFASESDLYSDKKLFMSATILGANTFLELLGYSPDDAYIIDLPSKFPVKNRPVYVLPGININYDVITNHPEKLNPMLDMLVELIKNKSESNENGIIFTSSYNLTKIIVNYLKMHLDEKSVEILFNIDTSQRDDILNKFKLQSNLPKILISCSFFEGVNLSADIARYSVVFKVPYKSLASKYVKAALTTNNTLYKIWALTDIIQAVGRSVRSEDDWAEAYIFDGSCAQLFKQNKTLIPKWFWESICFI